MTHNNARTLPHTLQALCPPVTIQITPHTHFIRQRDSWVRSPPGDNWGLATHTFQCWLGGPCSTDSSRTHPPHWPTRRGCCRQDHLLLCLQHCKHCSVCRREGQTGQLWTSAALATVGETTTTTVGMSIKVGRADRSAATIQSHTSAVSSDTAAAKLQGGHTTGDPTRQSKTGSEGTQWRAPHGQ